MATSNEITGDKIQSKVPSKAYLDNYDKIFKKEIRESDGNEAGVSDEEGALRYDVPETD